MDPFVAERPVMNSFSVTKIGVTKILGGAMVAVILGGCAGTPHAPPDRTPSWMKYQVLGSRIHRKIDVTGNPDTAHHVVTVDAGDLYRMPAVTIVTRRR
jgi:hypothetical protein